MLLIEVSEFMSVVDWCDFKEYLAHTQTPQTFITLPDGRVMEWFDDEVVHAFMTSGPTEDPKVHGPLGH